MFVAHNGGRTILPPTKEVVLMRRDQSSAEVLDSGTSSTGLRKTPTGISGIDELTGGGLPQGRSTLVCGPAGCGKTLLAMEFLVRGFRNFDEPGVFLSFEETIDDLVTNFVSLGFDLTGAEDAGQLVIDHINVGRGEPNASGDWDLDGLFLRLAAAIDTIGAKRVAIDTLENLFGAFPNAATLRSEMHRLFGWLKERGVTSLITAERGDGTLTRHGIEEYVSDCVIALDNRVIEQASTRLLRILKYRGSAHGTNEYPFFIGQAGVSVLPITSHDLSYPVSTERISTGVASLDAMLGDQGPFKGSMVLVGGGPGTGKSALVASLCEATCQRGKRAMYFSFEESPEEILRNTRSVGLHLARWVDEGLLELHCFRASLLGLEEHLFKIKELVARYDPAVVVKDPVSSLLGFGTSAEIAFLLTRQIDFLKARGITCVFTTLTDAFDVGAAQQKLASLADTWITIRHETADGTSERLLQVVKSRGMAHSNAIGALGISAQGLEITTRAGAAALTG
jgi:circadian clock protein KaiC